MAEASSLLASWIGSGRRTVNEVDTKRILQFIGVTVPQRDPGSGRCVVKLASDRFPHKTEHGLVRLNLTVEEVADAAAQMQAKDPGGTLLVEEMITDGVSEWIVGCRIDPTFGPIVLIGAGGIFVELFDDQKVRLAPLDHAEALRAICSQRAARLLAGLRGKPAGDTEALADLIVRLTGFFAEHSDFIEEIEVNPVIVRPSGSGVVAADALMILRAAS